VDALQAARAKEVACVVRCFAPRFQVLRKADSWVQRAIGRFAPKAYMESVWTTFGYTTYIPNSRGAGAAWATVAHEGRHALQARRWTRPLYAAAYLLPQLAGPVVALLGVLAGCLVTPWGFAGLLGLALLGPWRAPIRARWELEGYRAAVACAWWYAGEPPDCYLPQIAGWLDGPTYYRAASKAAVEAELRSWLTQLREGVALDPYLTALRDLATRYAAEDGVALARATVYA